MASVTDTGGLTRVDELYAEAERQFADWEVVKDLVDEMIDLTLNYRQSGHPGGSRSKVHLFLALLLSGGMRWDIRRPWLPFADRFVLSACHACGTAAAFPGTPRWKARRSS
jgi:transketolase N-terminal domain/subunit